MSPRIAVLPSVVADQIAAGEVVERPASVVKELVENAFDAGATAIEIAVADGGRDGIRVSDDGCGMERDDAILSIARHATSKIRVAADLVGVDSFGFRGEALPAICSVSHVEIETAAADGAGTRMRITGGTVDAVEDVARRRGTTIHVTRLFYNAPARRKFLRGARSEWRAITETVTALALARADVRLTLSNDGKPALVLPVAATFRDRVAALLGAAFAARLLVVEDVSGSTHISGLIERPGDVGTAGRRVHLSINGRAVRDTGITRAAEAAYKTTIPAGMRPTLFLEVVVAADAVDVNVHPAKAEVRFRDRWQIERAVEDAIRRALGTVDAAPSLGRVSWPTAAFVPPVPVDVGALSAPRSVGAGLFAPVPGSGSAADLAVAVDVEAQAGLPAAPIEEDIPPLLQLRRTYLMAERDDGVLLIDQHSAHERVLYEQFMRVLECGDAPAQRLLFPMTVHLTPQEADAFEEHRPIFEQLGFEIEGFGGHTLILRSVPMPHPRFDALRCVRDTLAALAGDRKAGATGRHEHLAATVACKAAIKAGETLSQQEMRALYGSLRATTLPAHDVHGRSTIVQLSWDEIERRFGRR